MPSYVEPPQFDTGDILGRANLGVFADNDNYFLALAERERVVHCVMSNDVLTGTSHTAWDGYIYLRTGTSTAATNFVWTFTATGGSGSINARLKLYDDNDSAYVVDSLSLASGVTDTALGSVDLSTVSGYTFSEGLHRCVLEINSKDNADDTCSVRFTRPPYCSYTGNLSFATAPTITDGSTSAAGHFNTWANNDRYFNACTPVQPAFCGMRRSWASGLGTSDIILWDGWVRHRYNRVHYMVQLESGQSAGGRVILFYDYDDTVARTAVANVSTDSDDFTEGTYDLPSGFTEKHWYRVTAILRRTSDTYSVTGAVGYIAMLPTTSEQGGTVTPLGALTPGQYVYGNTSGQDTRLHLLSLADAEIIRRLCWSALVGRYDWGVRKTGLARLGGTDTSDYRLKRLHDTLYHRSSGGIVRWGTDDTASLTDYGSDDYQTHNLHSLNTLQYGTIYYIDGTCEFAMEIPS